MGNTIRNSGIVLEKEDEEYVWTFCAILEPMFHAPNESEFGFIDVVSGGDGGEIFPANLQGAATQLTKHRGFQAVQHQPCTTSPPSFAPKEINPAPLIFAALMSVAISFHVYGAMQYYRGTIDSKVECKQ